MLYTRKGDAGTTQFYGNSERVSKASPITEALGSLDELNSYLGLCRAVISEQDTIFILFKNKKISLQKILHETQEVLFIVQAQVAGAKKTLHTSKIKRAEEITNSIEKYIPPLHAFSFSGGTFVSAHLDVARTLARKAERRVVLVHKKKLQRVHANTLSYLNRLSSVLFALARYANHTGDVREESPTYK
jgi:cob(I)alamin adenosyltransferase